MNSPIKILFVLATGWLTLTSASAQDRIHYTGTELSNPTYHDGQLSPVVGVHNIQLVRANREHPDVSNGGGWTYNHQPMLAYWNEQFYYQYLADPSDEHIPPSQTFLMTSKDGYNWTNPEIVFPCLPDNQDYCSHKIHSAGRGFRLPVTKLLLPPVNPRPPRYVLDIDLLLTMPRVFAIFSSICAVFLQTQLCTFCAIAAAHSNIFYHITILLPVKDAHVRAVFHAGNSLILRIGIRKMFSDFPECATATIASMIACTSTSASESPSGRSVCGISTPPNQWPSLHQFVYVITHSYTHFSFSSFL